MKTKKSSIHKKIINGYDVLFVHSPLNTIHIEAVISSGFIYETKHTSGVNHLLEHVIVSGWEKCKGSCNTYWDKKGAIINASTDNTNMKYYVKGLVSDTDEMVEYISSLTHSILNKTTFEDEKQAVIDELTSLSGDPTTQLLDVFNKEFYALDGLKYIDDWKLQIHNLKHLTISDLQREYDAFNTNNILFVIYGTFNQSHITRLFEKHLVLRKGKEIKKIECFSHSHKIVYSPFKMEGTTILIGFPSAVETSNYFECFKTLLHQVLFNEMRHIHKLLYDIEIHCYTTVCGTSILLEMNVRNHHIKKSIILLLKLLKQYCHIEIDDDNINSCKKTVLYKYHTDYSMMDYYTALTGPPLTKNQLIHQLKSFNASHFKTLCNRLFVFDQITCVYQGSTNANISWNNIE
jgi:predicted Zn-dependent peptidase